MYGLILIAAIIIIFAVNGLRLSREEKRRIACAVRASYGKKPSRKLTESRREALRRNLNLLSAGKKDGDIIDDLTWSDVGMDDIFLQADSCMSAAGEEYLYRRLHDISADREELERTDSDVRELEEDAGLRESLALSLSEFGYVSDTSLPEYLENIVKGEKFLNPFFHILADVFYLVIIVLIVLKPATGIVFLVVLIVLQISSYFGLRKKADRYMHGFSMIMLLAGLGKKLPDVQDGTGGIKGYAGNLKALLSKIRIKSSFSVFMAGSGSYTSGGLFSMIFTYINLLFHFDLIACQMLMNGIAKDKDLILDAYNRTGYLDMCIAIASYRAFLGSVSGCCTPVFIGDSQILIEDGYVPLIDKPVVNDAFNDGGVLITGSNASGKSTYMRMIAVNAILAQTIATCAAKSYKACFFRIYSSIAVNDNILKGESYFMAEIKSMKRIVDAGEKDGRKVLAFIDEILRGTNTSERIAAATAVLKHLKDIGVIVYAATHDIELTELAAGYVNVHFEEKIENDDVSFDFVLREGPSNTRNAIALLKKTGFPASVVEESEALASKLS